MLLVLSALLLLLTACLANERPVRVVTATPGGAPTRVAAALAAPAASAPALNPLTGLLLPDLAVLDRRPLAVKISNAPDTVRPQAGLALADLVFEHYVEGGLTRFTAIYWTHTPSRLGSIRSARLIDLELTAMYGAILVYSGANEPIRQRIAASTFAARAYEGVTVGAPLYFRDPAIEAPHNLFAVPAQVWARAAADGVNDAPNLRALSFSTAFPSGGEPAPAVTVNYGPDEVRWVYDPIGGLYTRYVDGRLHTDADTGTPITAANVVVLYVPHRDDESIPVGEWNGVTIYSTEIQLWESGPALIVRGHKADGQPLTLQSITTGKPATHTLALAFDQPYAERTFAVPAQRVAFRLLASPDNPLQVEVYHSDSDTPFLRTTVTGTSTIEVEGARYDFTPARYLLLTAVHEPVLPLATLGGILLLAGILAGFLFPARVAWVRLWPDALGTGLEVAVEHLGWIAGDEHEVRQLARTLADHTDGG